MIYLHILFIALLVGTGLFFYILDVLNLKFGEEKVKEEKEWLQSKFKVEDTDRLLAYNRLKSGFSQLNSFIGLVLFLIILYSGLFAELTRWVETFEFSPLVRGIIFFTVAGLIMILFNAPFSAFKSFVIEEIFDFNKQTVFLWMKDLLKGLLLTVIFTAIIAGAILWFISVLPKTWWLAAWGFMVFFGLLMQIIYPRLIAPLFNDFEQIEEGELYEAVREVFDRAGFECSQVYSMDASRRSGHSNAYFVGFGKTKRVVLFDTLIEQMELPELQAVLAHELAHWKKGHIWKNILLGAAKNLAVFYVLFYLLESSWLYGMFDIETSAIYAGLLLAMAWISPLNSWLSPLENYFSVRHEKEADSFALKVMQSATPMVEALYCLVGENLSNPFPHPLYTVFHYSHPPVPQRIKRLRREEKQE